MKTFTDSIFFNDLVNNGILTVNGNGELSLVKNTKQVAREQPAHSKKVVDDYYAFCNKPLEDYIIN